MTPSLNGFDHMHVYVTDRTAAENWYAKVLGFKRIKALESWAAGGGPLTLEDKSGAHLALFESDNRSGATAIAFAASGPQFLEWIPFLKSHDLTIRVSDHEMAFSLYFSDPDTNMYEITTYDHAFVRKRL